jgi:hypothetical protein
MCEVEAPYAKTQLRLRQAKNVLSAVDAIESNCRKGAALTEKNAHDGDRR